MHERFFSSHEFSYEKCSEIFPEIFEPLFCGSEKIPGKFPPNFPLNFQISLRKIKKIHRRASAGAQREYFGHFLGAPTIKAVGGTVSVKGIFGNGKGRRFLFRGVRSPCGTIGSPYGGSVPLTTLFYLFNSGRN